MITAIARFAPGACFKRTLFAVALIAPVLEGRARAQPADAERQVAAQVLFDDAQRLTSAGKYGEACPKLAESERLDPSIGTQFYLADCLEHEGKIASAWTNFIGAADGAKLAGQQDREAFARKRAEALAPKIPKLTITVADALRGAPGLEVKRDGSAVGAPQWGAAIPLDPGEHAITASAPGKLPWEAKVVAQGDGATLSVAVPVLKDAPAPLGVDASRPALVEAPIDRGPSASGRGQRIAGLVVGGAGLVGIAVGAGFGFGAIGKQNAAEPHCDANNRCDPTGITLRHDGITDATISTVGFVVGGVALAAGALVVLTAPSSKVRGLGATGARIAIGPGDIRISGSW